MEQYQPLMAKMHADTSRNNTIAKNMSLLYHLELILGLHAILPILDSVHTFIKLA
jgi:hypothetical protein